VWTVTLSWESWRAITDALRSSGIDYHAEHADLLEGKLEGHGSGEEAIRLSLSDDIFLRSVNWVRWRYGIAIPAERK
jgi:hypothetical protein